MSDTILDEFDHDDEPPAPPRKRRRQTPAPKRPPACEVVLLDDGTPIRITRRFEWPWL